MSEAVGYKENLKKTPLYKLHKENNAKLVEFAGHILPIQYETGILNEHNHTRESAGLFDVSHMGQIKISGGLIFEALEKILPLSFSEMKQGQIKYTQLLNKDGGIIDDLMVYKPLNDSNHVRMVVNADCIQKDLKHLSSNLNNNFRVELLNDRALIALQGPLSANILNQYIPGFVDMPFMTFNTSVFDGEKVLVSRCGYTGEDGYEISIPGRIAYSLANKILSNKEVKLIGLGARDSLRMEAGLCLYGHDIDLNTTPIEAGLGWTLSKKRLKQGNFLGSKIIKKQINKGPEKILVGIKPFAQIPAREGTTIHDSDGKEIGIVTSGGYSPSLKAPISIGYIKFEKLNESQEVFLKVREKMIPSTCIKLPFVSHKYFKGN